MPCAKETEYISTGVFKYARKKKLYVQIKIHKKQETQENIILKMYFKIFLRFCNCFENNLKSATNHKCYVSLCNHTL